TELMPFRGKAALYWCVNNTHCMGLGTIRSPGTIEAEVPIRVNFFGAYVTDIVSPLRRSQMMSGIRSRNTGPEMKVRRALHRQGYRFRLHRKDLPGTPDIVLPGRRIVVFVHGCFWHLHEGCRLARLP